MNLPLRPYQEAAITQLYDTDVLKPLIVHPTGSGKTVTFTTFLTQRMQTGRGLVLCHRDELINQTVNKIHAIEPRTPVGVVKAERNEMDASIIVASVPTIQRRLASVPDDVSTVIVDEAHHANAKSWKKIIDTFDDRLIVGFTATPERGDGKPLSDVWDKIIHRVSLVELIMNGYLCDARGQLVGLGFDTEGIRTSYGDYVATELAGRMESELDKVADGYVEYAADRKGIIYTVSVDHAHQLAGLLRDRGIAAEALDGTMPIEDRRRILADLARGTVQVVTNCAVLTEGFDEPSVSAIGIARPTRSRPLYQQMIGRGLRTFPGKDHCLVLDFVGASIDHSLITLSSLASDEPAKPINSLYMKVIIDYNMGRRDSLELYAGVSTTYDLFRSHLKWLPVKRDTVEGYVLPTGGEDILMIPLSNGEWDVALTRNGRMPQAIRTGLTLGYAQGYAEEIIRQREAEYGVNNSLARRRAQWNRSNVTSPQIMKLRSLGVQQDVINKLSNCGQASDLISRLYGRKAMIRYLRSVRDV